MKEMARSGWRRSPGPDLVHSEKWAVAQAGDAVSKTMDKPGAPYHLIGTITVKDAKVLELYQEGR